MTKIILLDQNLANQIAAGEVVERPVSVVKELVENSIDAGAKNIKVIIKNAGKDFIEVQDDGEGIERDDLEIALNKYTTSKIKSIDDLYRVLTFWFRGEALASISSVSRFCMISKTKDSQVAYKLEFDTISGKNISETSGNVGTKICVTDLFFNTPARLNYLKTQRTEYAKILDYLHAVSLSYPEIGFEFMSDEKKIFKYNQDENLKTRMYLIYGNDILDNILDIHFETVGVKISGYITDPKISFPTKNRQNLFVNHRPISSPLIFKAISDAYNRFIPHGNHPWYVLNIQVDPTIIDVNVHPRKSEIRFENEQNIFRSVYHALLNKLESSSLVNNIPLMTGEGQGVRSEKYYTWSWEKFKSYSPYKNTSSNPNQYTISDSLDFTKTLLDTSISPNRENWEMTSFETWDLHYTKLGKIVGQTFNSYIVVEKDDTLILLDQHALAERIIYEKLVKNDSKHHSQNLLIPETIKLTASEFSLLEEKKDIFISMGFELEFLRNSLVSVGAIPDFMKKENVSEIILWIIQDIFEGNSLQSKTIQEVKNKIFAYTACRSAVKFGNKLNLFEMNKLLNEATVWYSSTCPHGRPVIFEISLEELKNKYER